ncbi:MAG: DUF2147 domain-containing protein [Pseudomonadota bacterium]
MRNALLLLLLIPAAAAHAQQSPIGRWKTFDAGKPKGIVEIYRAPDGTLAGKVVEVLDLKEGRDPACIQCRGALRNRPIVGMVTLQGLKPAGSGRWTGGSVLDPENGKSYKAKLDLLDAGRKLGMSGCIGFLCRQQVWVRE